MTLFQSVIGLVLAFEESALSHNHEYSCHCVQCGRHFEDHECCNGVCRECQAGNWREATARLEYWDRGETNGSRPAILDEYLARFERVKVRRERRIEMEIKGEAKAKERAAMVRARFDGR